MSRIDALIKELCPDGVPFEALGDLGTFVRGNGMQKKDLVDSGFPAIHYGQIHTSYGLAAAKTRSFVKEELAEKMRKASPGNLVIVTTSEDDESVGKAVAWVGNTPVCVSTDAYIYRHSLDPKYVSYFFQSSLFQDQKRHRITGTKVRRISGDSLAKIKIPVPPVAVQREVVGVLDLFQALEVELRAERTVRRIQFGHYRDRLLGFHGRSDVKWLPLSELGEFHRGRRFTKADYAPDGIPAIHYGEIYTHYGTTARSVVSHLRPNLATALRFAQPGDVVIVDVGETAEDVGKAVAWIGDEPVAIHDHSYAFRHHLNPAFVAYCMQTLDFRAARAKHVARTKVKTLLIDGFARLQIPVPTLEEQEQIVGDLNAFEVLLDDASIGLPAELAARRIQYEHYRDRLLTFQESVA